MDVDLGELVALIDALRQNGVREYHNGDFHLSLDPVREDVKAVTLPKMQLVNGNPKYSMYEKVFGRTPPSFDQFRDMGLVTEEK